MAHTHLTPGLATVGTAAHGRIARDPTAKPGPIPRLGLPLVAAFAMAACSGTPKVPALTSAVLTRYNFDYAVSPPGQIEIAQVFDDGRSTWLQLRRISSGEPVVRAGGTDPPLAATRNGPLERLDGVYPRLDVTIGSTTFQIVNVQRAAPAAIRSAPQR